MSNKDNVLLNIDKRLFYISDNIDNISIGRIAFNLLYLLQEDDEKESKEKDFIRNPIRIYINSCGGSVDDMWALIDIMINSKSPIYTYCTGYAYSAAFQLFLAGSKRFVSKHANLMYHQISCWRSGKYQDLVEDRKEMDRYQAEIEYFVSSRTNITMDKLKEIREKKIDWYIHSEESLDIGVATDLII